MTDHATHPESILAALQITLPEAPAPAASYLPYMQSDDHIFTAGQIAVGPDKQLIASGIVGREVTLEEAQGCARQCAINILAQLKAATGDLARVKRVVKLTVFVASSPDFTSQHLVANAASELVAQVFGEAGRHARSAVGVASLPLNSPVEIEAIVALHDKTDAR